MCHTVGMEHEASDLREDNIYHEVGGDNDDVYWSVKAWDWDFGLVTIERGDGTFGYYEHDTPVVIVWTPSQGGRPPATDAEFAEVNL